VNRLEISSTEQKGLPELMQDVTEGGAKSKTKGALEGAGEKLMSVLGEDDREPAGKRSKERD
jgi:gas vesicle structural protein